MNSALPSLPIEASFDLSVSSRAEPTSLNPSVSTERRNAAFDHADEFSAVMNKALSPRSGNVSREIRPPEYGETAQEATGSESASALASAVAESAANGDESDAVAEPEEPTPVRAAAIESTSVQDLLALAVMVSLPAPPPPPLALAPVKADAESETQSVALDSATLDAGVDSSAINLAATALQMETRNARLADLVRPTSVSTASVLPAAATSAPTSASAAVLSTATRSTTLSTAGASAPMVVVPTAVASFSDAPLPTEAVHSAKFAESNLSPANIAESVAATEIEETPENTANFVDPARIPVPRNATAVRGTAVAEQHTRMATPAVNDPSATPGERNSPQGNETALELQADAAPESAPERGANFSPDSGAPEKDPSVRSLTAMDWLEGRPAGLWSDRPAFSWDWHRAAAVNTTSPVDRVSQAIVTESLLLTRQDASSMAVVLKPDAQTELRVSLVNRGDHVEAVIRCERGDMQHLGAAWGQLQESLANHRIRLAPLENASWSQNSDDARHAQQFSSADSSTGNGGQSPRRESAPGENHSSELLPVSASATPAIGTERGSGFRSSTSRPGWETWA